jgi:predicted Zn-dependent peptidase
LKGNGELVCSGNISVKKLEALLKNKTEGWKKTLEVFEPDEPSQAEKMKHALYCASLKNEIKKRKHEEGCRGV